MSNPKPVARNLRIPTTSAKLAKPVLKQRALQPEMALPHDGVSPADDVTDLLRR